MLNFKAMKAIQTTAKQKPELKYSIGLLSFLTLLWSVTLSWFYVKLEINFALLPVAIWLGLMLLTLLLCYVLLHYQNFRLQTNTQTFNVFWLALLGWIMMLNAGLLYETGGTINPLMHLLLLPLALGMLILSTPFFMLLALFSAGFYVILSFYYVPIMTLKVTSLQAFFAWHLHGSMLVFMLLVLLLATLILPLKKRLEAQRAALESQRNAALQNEYLLSLASIASASAHQLSTPLNTLTLLEPLIRKEVSSELGQSYLQTFSEQIQVCNQALQGLRRRANYSPKNAQHNLEEGIDCQQLLADLRQEFALIHPKSVLQIQPLVIDSNGDGQNPLLIDASISAPRNMVLKVDQSFKLAIMNLLDNAARYSPDYVSIKFELTSPGLFIMVEDEGGGMPETDIKTLGEQPLDDYYGIGMGVFLTRMIVERFAGKLTFTNIQTSSSKGLRACLFLPMSVIRMQEDVSSDT